MTQDNVNVTDADREAAQALCASGWTHAIEAFARHRTAAEAEARKREAVLVEALEEIEAATMSRFATVADLANWRGVRAEIALAAHRAEGEGHA